MIRRRVPQAST